MDIQDKSLVQKVKQACKMIVGVASVKLDINVWSVSKVEVVQEYYIKK